MKYKIGNVEVEANFSSEYKEWIVDTKTSSFCLSEQDFNNMATKVKEPKFKVGDIVYLKDEGDDVFNLEKCVIEKVCEDGDFIHYHLEEWVFKTAEEHELITLEEAIEKLKEL